MYLTVENESYLTTPTVVDGKLSILSRIGSLVRANDAPRDNFRHDWSMVMESIEGLDHLFWCNATARGWAMINRAPDKSCSAGPARTSTTWTARHQLGPLRLYHPKLSFSRHLASLDLTSFQCLSTCLD